MELQIPPERMAELERRIVQMQPWMHKYKISQEVYTGFYKYHGISETGCVSSSPPELRRRMSAAFDDYMRGQPDFLLDHLIERLADTHGSCSFLDVGCGTGRSSFYLALRGAGEVHGIEIRENQVEQCKLIQEADVRFPKINLRFEHIARSADDGGILEGKTYDVVLSLELLYCLTDPVQHLHNLARLTGKCAVVQTMVHEGPADLWKLILQDRTRITKAAGGIGWMPSYKALPELLLRAGFSRVEVVVHPLLQEAQGHLVAGLAPTPDRPSGALRKLENMARRAPAVGRVLRVLSARRGWKRSAGKSMDRLLRLYQNPCHLAFLAFK